MEWVKQFLMLFVSVFLIMVIIYLIRKGGAGLPIIGPVVQTVWN